MIRVSRRVDAFTPIIDLLHAFRLQVNMSRLSHVEMNVPDTMMDQPEVRLEMRMTSAPFCPIGVYPVFD